MVIRVSAFIWPDYKPCKKVGLYNMIWSALCVCGGGGGIGVCVVVVVFSPYIYNFDLIIYIFCQC